jgi:hypothetical protein
MRCDLGPTSPRISDSPPDTGETQRGDRGCNAQGLASCRGISGRWGQRRQRPGFDRLLTQPRAAKVAWSVERLGRSLQGPRWFFWGAERSRMRSLLKRQAVDTTRPAGRAIFQMLGVFRGVRTRDHQESEHTPWPNTAWVCLFLAPIGSMPTIEMDRCFKIWINATAPL